MGGAIGVKPASLDTASDLTVSDLHWTAWDVSGATGQGRLRLPTCQPTCAAGGSSRARGDGRALRAEDLRRARYFDHAEVRVDPKVAPSGMQPASYVRAPC